MRLLSFILFFSGSVGANTFPQFFTCQGQTVLDAANPEAPIAYNSSAEMLLYLDSIEHGISYLRFDGQKTSGEIFQESFGPQDVDNTPAEKVNGVNQDFKFLAFPMIDVSHLVYEGVYLPNFLAKQVHFVFSFSSSALLPESKTNSGLLDVRLFGGDKERTRMHKRFKLNCLKGDAEQLRAYVHFFETAPKALTMPTFQSVSEFSRVWNKLTEDGKEIVLATALTTLALYSLKSTPGIYSVVAAAAKTSAQRLTERKITEVVGRRLMARIALGIAGLAAASASSMAAPLDFALLSGDVPEGQSGLDYFFSVRGANTLINYNQTSFDYFTATNPVLKTYLGAIIEAQEKNRGVSK